MQNDDAKRIEGENTGGEANNNQYIEAINEMRKNTVSKEEYQKLQDENKNLLKSLVNGEYREEEKKEPIDVNRLREDLFNNEHTNLDFIKKSLELRTELIARGEPDPFLPIGDKVVPTEEDIATANRVAQVFQECVDYANGDSVVFTNELARRTIDTAPNRGRR